MLTRVLIYKRTHNDDPDSTGCFGSHDCMKSFRARRFDAVIGIGGIGAEARDNGIAGKLNWIGIGPHKRNVKGKIGPVVTFDHLLSYGTAGPDFGLVAPQLAKRIYQKNIRCLVHGYSAQELTEVNNVLRRASRAPASRPLSSSRVIHSRPTCKSKRIAFGRC